MENRHIIEEALMPSMGRRGNSAIEVRVRLRSSYGEARVRSEQCFYKITAKFFQPMLEVPTSKEPWLHYENPGVPQGRPCLSNWSTRSTWNSHILAYRT
jgi:hypothetical protein